MERFYEFGERDALTKSRMLRYANKLGWKTAAIAYMGETVARCGRCQSPDVQLYMDNFKAQRVAR